jgi:hypothetical protein
LTVERNDRIANKTGWWNKMPGLFLLSRLLQLLYKVNPNPSDDIFSEIALLVWIPVNEVKQLKRSMNKTCSVLNKIKPETSGKQQNSTKEIRVGSYKRNVKKKVYHAQD